MGLLLVVLTELSSVAALSTTTARLVFGYFLVV